MARRDKYIKNLVPKPADNRSMVEKLTDMSEADRRAWIKKNIPPSMAKKLRWDWRFTARPNQLPPEPIDSWGIWTCLAGRGFGKAVPLNTLIPTPSGFTLMGELSIGSKVFDENGQICSVTALFDIPFPEKAYRFHFSDGSYIDSCSEHQWVTWTHAERKAFLRSPYENKSKFPENWPQWKLQRICGGMFAKPEIVEKALAMSASGNSLRKIEREIGANRHSLATHIKAGKFVERIPKIYEGAPRPQIRTSQEIVNTLTYGKRRDTNHCIPNCGPLNLPETNLPIPPYSLGAWLGDGSHSSGEIYGHFSDLPHILSEMGKEGLDVYKGHQAQIKNTIKVYIKGLSPILKKINIFKNKHIPSVYLRASIQQRLSLLQGLMDTDGCAEQNGKICTFVNTNKSLVDSVYELIISLGMRATISSKNPTYTYKGKKRKGKLAWQITFAPTMQVFKLPRKANKLTFGGAQSLRRHHRMIVRAEEIPPVPMRCITVDSPNSMYLVGREMIPTHNTRTGLEWVRMMVESGRAKRIALISPTARDISHVLIKGEALDVNTPILTTVGWKLMRDIQVNDFVYSEKGEPTRVKWASSIEEGRPCYKVKFSDGEELIADAEHKWLTYTKAARRGKRFSYTSHFPSVKNTKEIAETLKIYGLYNHTIPCTEPLCFEDKELPVDPYVLGAWLGDGGSRGDGSFSSVDDFIINEIRNSGYTVTKRADKFGWGILKLNQKLKEYQLNNNKHIPEIYLRGSINQRIALVQGLMDTDGYASKQGNCYFYNTNYTLMVQVRDLLLSLGIKVGKVYEKPLTRTQKLNFKNAKLEYALAFTTSVPVFRLPRKSVRQKFNCSEEVYFRTITSVEKIDSVPVKCIAVESENQLFLAGRALIATHNSGILNISPPDFMPHWSPANMTLTWPNGAIAEVYSAEEPDRLRGPQHDAALCDELGAWKKGEEVWDMLQFTMRVGKNPQIVVTTTPKPIQLLKDILSRDDCVTTVGDTFENVGNLAPRFIEQIKKLYENSRLGEQELYADIVEDVPGAYWKISNIEYHRIKPEEIHKVPDFLSVVVAVDPATTSKKNSAETGIAVVAYGTDDHFYILYADSFKEEPEKWAQRVLDLYDYYKADRIIAEDNNGGDLVAAVINNIRPLVPVESVHAARGKITRAEPIAVLYDRGRVHHVGYWKRAEEQMTEFNPIENAKGKKDIVDALVWGVTKLVEEADAYTYDAPSVGGLRSKLANYRTF